MKQNKWTEQIFSYKHSLLLPYNEMKEREAIRGEKGEKLYFFYISENKGDSELICTPPWINLVKSIQPLGGYTNTSLRLVISVWKQECSLTNTGLGLNTEVSGFEHEGCWTVQLQSTTALMHILYIYTLRAPGVKDELIHFDKQNQSTHTKRVQALKEN